MRVWDFRDGPRLVRTIRPPIWRGPAGIDLRDGSVAQAGRAGSVAPGRRRLRRREPAGRHHDLPRPGPDADAHGGNRESAPPSTTNDPQAIGHRNTVLCLAFDPSGRILASGGMDRHGDPLGRADLPAAGGAEGPHRAEVRALAFSPDGRRLATAGTDGSRPPLGCRHGCSGGRAAWATRRLPVIINTLAVSPDGLSIVIGRENGELFRLRHPEHLADRPVRLPTLAGQGSVESLAYHPDGRRLAVSIKSDRADTLDPMRIACDLEIRAMPGGKVMHRRRVPGLVYACAFSPDGGQLAYSGGTAQAIFIQDLRDLRKPPDELKGPGHHDLRSRLHGRQPGDRLYPRAVRPGQSPPEL